MGLYMRGEGVRCLGPSFVCTARLHGPCMHGHWSLEQSGTSIICITLATARPAPPRCISAPVSTAHAHATHLFEKRLPLVQRVHLAFVQRRVVRHRIRRVERRHPCPPHSAPSPRTQPDTHRAPCSRPCPQTHCTPCPARTSRSAERRRILCP